MSFFYELVIDDDNYYLHLMFWAAYQFDNQPSFGNITGF